MVQWYRSLQGLRREGFREWFRQVWRLGEYRGGRLVGQDQLGNRYYEIVDDPQQLSHRRRYVDYARSPHDASQVPAEWHGWLHQTNDQPPTQFPYAQWSWQAGHTENLTGTVQAYIPRSTVPPKYEAFNPTPQQLLEASQRKQLK